MHNVLSVTDASNRIKEIIEDDFILSNILIKGEISNYKKHTSGHHYFTLKDENSVINAIIFKFDALKMRIKLENGMKIIASGRISTFIQRGQYQFYINEIQVDGIGDLHIEFDKLKNKLYKEGLFDSDNKKKLPRFPEKIAIVTAKTGAAIQDMLRILENRYKLAEIEVFSVKVQGEGADLEISDAINYINNLNLADVIIIGRGGGSIEDLWAFNSETLAYTIYASNIPIISAVGHEPDYTISDYVSDVRASTPSNASEIVAPDTQSIRVFLENMQNEMNNFIENLIFEKRTQIIKSKVKTPINIIDEKRMYIDYLISKFKNPENLIKANRSSLEIVKNSMNSNYIMKISKKRQKTIELMAYIDGYSPMKVLSRGFGYSLDENKDVITSVKNVKISDEITTQYSDGIIKSKILNIKEK